MMNALKVGLLLYSCTMLGFALIIGMNSGAFAGYPFAVLGCAGAIAGQVLAMVRGTK